MNSLLIATLNTQEWEKKKEKKEKDYHLYVCMQIQSLINVVYEISI